MELSSGFGLLEQIMYATITHVVLQQHTVFFLSFFFFPFFYLFIFDLLLSCTCLPPFVHEIKQPALLLLLF